MQNMNHCNGCKNTILIRGRVSSSRVALVCSHSSAVKSAKAEHPNVIKTPNFLGFMNVADREKIKTPRWCPLRTKMTEGELCEKR